MFSQRVIRKPYSLTTVDLQKAGSRLLRLSPKRILDVSMHTAGYVPSHTIVLTEKTRSQSTCTNKAFSHIHEQRPTSSTLSLTL